MTFSLRRGLMGSLAGVLLAPAGVWSEDFEVALSVGSGFPSFSQAFRLPGVPSPLVEVRQEGVLRLESGRGLALSGAVTWRMAGGAGLEARLEAVDADGRGQGVRAFSVAQPQGGLGHVRSDLSIVPGPVQSGWFVAFSLNLKGAVSWKRLRFSASAGPSYLPDPHFAVELAARVAVEVEPFPGVTVNGGRLRARLDPEDDHRRFGFNVGAGFGYALGRRASTVFEVHYFRFPERTYRWHAPGASVVHDIAGILQRSLEPVHFEPDFVQMTAGVAVEF